MPNFVECDNLHRVRNLEISWKPPTKHIEVQSYTQKHWKKVCNSQWKLYRSKRQSCNGVTWENCWRRRIHLELVDWRTNGGKDTQSCTKFLYVMPNFSFLAFWQRLSAIFFNGAQWSKFWVFNGRRYETWFRK